MKWLNHCTIPSFIILGIVFLSGCAGTMALEHHADSSDVQMMEPPSASKRPILEGGGSDNFQDRLGGTDIGFGKRPLAEPKPKIVRMPTPPTDPSLDGPLDELIENEDSLEMEMASPMSPEDLEEDDGLGDEESEEEGVETGSTTPESDEDSVGILLPHPAEVKIFIDGNERGVASCDMSLSYDPAIVAIETVTSDAYIPGEGTILADVQKPGVVRVVGFTIRAETRGADEAVANVRFRAIMAGVSTIKVDLRQAADTDDEVIDDAKVRLSADHIEVRLR